MKNSIWANGEAEWRIIMAAIEGISNLSNSGVNYQQAKPAPKVEAVSENVSQQVSQDVASQVVTVKQTEEKKKSI